MMILKLISICAASLSLNKTLKESIVFIIKIYVIKDGIVISWL